MAETVKPLARTFGVSEWVIARRLLDLGLITDDEYGRLNNRYRSRWQRIKENRKGGGGGPSHNVLDRYYFGEKTLGTLTRAAESGFITLVDAARTLNMSVARFEKVAG